MQINLNQLKPRSVVWYEHDNVSTVKVVSKVIEKKRTAKKRIF